MTRLVHRHSKGTKVKWIVPASLQSLAGTVSTNAPGEIASKLVVMGSGGMTVKLYHIGNGGD
jgi:hypothetical protein